MFRCCLDAEQGASSSGAWISTFQLNDLTATASDLHAHDPITLFLKFDLWLAGTSRWGS